MNFFSFLLDGTGAGSPTTPTGCDFANSWPMLIFAGVIIIFFVFSWRNNKKRTKAENDMRDNLRVGDEITTIGGVVGKIVSLREETMVIETSKDKTHIRFLRAALRSVDVKAEDSVDPRKAGGSAPATQKNAQKGTQQKSGTIERAAIKDNAPVEEPFDNLYGVNDAVESTEAQQPHEPRKRGKKVNKAKRAARAEAETLKNSEEPAQSTTEAPAEEKIDVSEITAALDALNATENTEAKEETKTENE